LTGSDRLCHKSRMKGGHLIKEEIQFYFRIAFEGRVAAGTGRRDSLSLYKLFLFSLGVSRGDISLFSSTCRGAEPSGEQETEKFETKTSGDSRPDNP